MIKFNNKWIVSSIGVVFLVVPLFFAWAQVSEFPFTGNPLRSVAARLTLKGLNGSTFMTFNANGTGKMTGSSLVNRGEPFYIEFDSDGIDSDGVKVTQGIDCRSNWGSLGSSDSLRGKIMNSRMLSLVCIGIGAGYRINGTLSIGAADLTILNASMEGPSLVPDAPDRTYYYNDPMEFLATIKNMGNAPVRSKMIVNYYTGATPTGGTRIHSAEVAVADSLASGSEIPVPKFVAGRMTGAAATGGATNEYFRVCVNDAPVAGSSYLVPESDTSNNCKVLGPFKFVKKPN